jgi:hypothetical protein
MSLLPQAGFCSKHCHYGFFIQQTGFHSESSTIDHFMFILHFHSPACLEFYGLSHRARVPSHALYQFQKGAAIGSQSASRHNQRELGYGSAHPVHSCVRCVRKRRVQWRRQDRGGTRLCQCGVEFKDRDRVAIFRRSHPKNPSTHPTLLER